MSITLSGDTALRTKFNRMDQATRGQSLVRAVKSGASPVLNDATAHAPVKTGTYRRSLHVGAEQVGAHEASVQIGSDVEYGIYLEMGTSKMAARPHLRPALESQRGAAESEMGATLLILIMGAVG